MKPLTRDQAVAIIDGVLKQAMMSREEYARHVKLLVGDIPINRCLSEKGAMKYIGLGRPMIRGFVDKGFLHRLEFGDRKNLFLIDELDALIDERFEAAKAKKKLEVA